MLPKERITILLVLLCGFIFISCKTTSFQSVSKNHSQSLSYSSAWIAPLLYQIATNLNDGCGSSDTIRHNDKKRINDIDPNDRCWNAPLLYSIVIWPHDGTFDWDGFTIRSNNIHYPEAHGSLLLCNRMFYTGTLDYHSPYSEYDVELWLFDLGKYDAFHNTVKVILKQFKELANRLSILRQSREQLIRKYNDKSLATSIDKDIIFLTSLGLRLADTTRQFFNIAKEQMKRIDISKARTEGLRGMKTFSERIDLAASDTSMSLESTVDYIIKAVNELETAINQ